MVSNIEIDKKENSCILSINPKIYSLDVIYSAAYVFLDKAYLLLDGDPETEIIVKLKPKEEYSLEKLGDEFNNELINYSYYKVQSMKNQRIREAIIQRALLTNEMASKDTGADYKEDPQSIAVSWEEKYSKKTSE